MIERKSFHILHKDGTSTILGAKDQSFDSFGLPSQSVSEIEIRNEIKQASLPFEEKAETIVGWGGFSVAVRLENHLSPNSPKEVIVLRPLLAEDVIKTAGELSCSWKDEQTVNKQFTPFTFPQHLIVANGIDGMPTALKIAKEVEGATLKDSSLLAILSNSSVLEQYIKFCQRALSVFVSEGKLIDTSGHLTRNKLRQLQVGMIPFYSDNLMVEYGSNKLVLVDCDVKPAIHFFRKADKVQKVGILMRAGFIGTTAAVAKAPTLAHQLRNRFLGENYTTENRDRIKRSEEYQNFVAGIEEIVQILNSIGLNYRILGSVGLAGTIQSRGGEFHLTPRRKNKTRRNIDILVLEHDSEKIEKLKKYLTERSKSIKGYPAVNLGIPIKIGEVKCNAGYFHERILLTEITKPGINQEGNFCLFYKDLISPINRNYLQPVFVEYEGTTFPTVSPGVLAGFYLTRGGNFKPKDLEKIEILSAHTKFQIPAVFRDFAHTIRHNYPRFYNNFLIREWLSYWSGGFVSGGQITRFVDRFQA